MKDRIGQELYVGDTIVLARRLGNYAEMVIREVLEIKESDDYHKQALKVRPIGSNRSGWTHPYNTVTLRNIVKEENNE